jgi:hypothetical protein
LHRYRQAGGRQSGRELWQQPEYPAGTGGGGGVWMASRAGGDSNGDIYVVTGNGPHNRNG